MNKTEFSAVSRTTLQWHLGEWLGTVLGGSAWMLVSGFYLLTLNRGISAAICFTCFIVVNAVGFLLWKNRKNIEPFSGRVAIMAILALLVPIAWFSITLSGARNGVDEVAGPFSSFQDFFVCLLVPFVMIWSFSKR